MGKCAGMRWAWGVGAAAAALFSGCIYLQDTLPMELGEGDVTGVLVGVPPGEVGDVRALGGGRVRLRGQAAWRSANAQGRFVIRNLGEGSHVLDLMWDPGHDGVADLGRVLEVRIRIPAGRTKRPGVDLGDVELLRPGSIEGVVTGGAPYDTVVVNLFAFNSVTGEFELSPFRAFPDPATGAYRVDGVGAGEWELQAARGVARAAGDLTLGSQRERVSVPSDSTAHAAPLVLADLPTGSLGGTLVEPLPGTSTSGTGVTTQGLFTEVTVTLTPVHGGPELMFHLADLTGTEVRFERSELPTGVYTVRIEAGPEFTPLAFPFVVVAGQINELGRLILTALDEVGADLDRDGYLFAGRDHCVAECVGRAAADLDDPCEEGGTRWDCDDDADGQADADEMNPADLCRCGPTGEVTEAGCENDPLRADRDHDDICDLYDRFPLCDLNRDPCQAPDAGPPDAGTDAGPPPVDAGSDAGPPPVDAGVDAGPPPVDAGVDAGQADAGQDAGPTDAGFDAGPTPWPGFDGGASLVLSGAMDGGYARLGQAGNSIESNGVVITAFFLEGRLDFAGGACAPVELGVGGNHANGYVIVRFDADHRCLWRVPITDPTWHLQGDALQGLALASSGTLYASLKTGNSTRILDSDAGILGEGVQLVLALDAATGQVTGLTELFGLRGAVSPMRGNLLWDETDQTLAVALLSQSFNGDAVQLERLGPDFASKAEPVVLHSFGSLALGELSHGSVVLPGISTQQVTLDPTDGGTAVPTPADGGGFYLRVPPTGAPEFHVLPVGNASPPMDGMDMLPELTLHVLPDGTGDLVTGTLKSGALLLNATVGPKLVWGDWYAPLQFLLHATAGFIDWEWFLRRDPQASGGSDGGVTLVRPAASGGFILGSDAQKQVVIESHRAGTPNVSAELLLPTQPRSGAFVYVVRVEPDGSPGQMALAWPASAGSHVLLQDVVETADGSLVAMLLADGPVETAAVDCAGDVIPGSPATTEVAAGTVGLYFWPIPAPAGGSLCALPVLQPTDLQVGTDQPDLAGVALDGTTPAPARVTVSGGTPTRVDLDVGPLGDQDCFLLAGPELDGGAAELVVGATVEGTACADTVLLVEDLMFGVTRTILPAGAGQCPSAVVRVAAGAQLAVCLQGRFGTRPGAVTLVLDTVAPPANDRCGSEPPVMNLSAAAPTAALSGTTAAANHDSVTSCGFGGDPDVYYVFRTDAPGAVSITMDQAADPGSFWFSIQSGDCAGQAEVGCSFAGPGSTQVPVSANLDYRLVMMNRSGLDQPFTATLTFTSFTGHDSCADVGAPVRLVAGTPHHFTGNFYSAVRDGPIDCNGYPQDYPDVFHAVQAPADGVIIVQGVDPSSQWTVIRDYGADCTGGVQLACEAGPLVLRATPDAVHALSFQDGPATLYDVQATFYPPEPNDTCAQAGSPVALTDAAPTHLFSGSTLGASHDVNYTYAPANGPDIAYAFTAARDGRVTVALPDYGFYGYWAILQDGCATEMSSGWLDVTPSPAVTVRAGVTYQLVVTGQNQGMRRPVDVNVTLLPLPPNDTCAAAESLGTLSSARRVARTSGTLVGAMQHTAAASCSGGVGELPDVFYTLDVAEAGNLLVRARGTQPYPTLFVYGVVTTGACTALTEASNGCSQTTYTWGNPVAVGPGTYTLVVQGASPTDQKAFDLEVRLVEPSGASDLCTGAPDLLAAGATGAVTGALSYAMSNPNYSALDYLDSLGATCGPYTVGGADVAWTFTLAPGATLDLGVTTDSGDLVAYVLDACPDLGGTPLCITGAQVWDDGVTPSTSTTLSVGNTGTAARTYYLFLDTATYAYHYVVEWNLH